MHDTESSCANFVFEDVSGGTLDWGFEFKEIFTKWDFLLFFVFGLLEGHFFGRDIFLKVQITGTIGINTGLASLKDLIDGLSLAETDDTGFFIRLGGEFGDGSNFGRDGFDGFDFFDLWVGVGLLDSFSLVEKFFVLLEGLFDGFGEVETDLFSVVGVLVGFSLDTSVGRLLFGVASSQFIVEVHHAIFNDYIMIWLIVNAILK